MGIAGCGGSPASGSSKSSSQAGPFAYTRCIQRHGVPQFPDPVVHTTGSSTSVTQMVPQGVADSPAFRSAQKTCASLQPGPGTGASDHHGPSKPVLLAFTRCLRGHGIAHFPDPTGQGQLSLTMISSAGVNIHAPGFFTAARGCLGVTRGQITLRELGSLINGPH
jgi:hypothetical protein